MRTLELYKDGKKINEQPENENGRTTIRIENLDSNTTYEKGAYKLAWSKNGEVSDLVDVPSFKTKSVAVQEVVVSSESITLNKGDTNNVGASVIPDNADNKSLIYSSNNEDVATVSDSGDVEAIKSGDATITIKSQENETISAEVRVNVKTPVTDVSVEPETATLDIGDTQQLSANVLPSDADNKKVTYSTGSDAIATVSDTGLVTAVAEGTTDITVTTEDGAKIATSSITVEKAVVNVTGVTLDKSTLSLEEGATGNLVATVAPSTATDKTVTFASSDAEVATVDNTGKVTAVKPGAADITVTTKDGAKTAKCALTVTAKKIAVTGVTIAPKTATLEIGETQQLTPTVAPANASDKTVTYTTKASGIATVNDAGVITAKAEGKTQIVATTKDGAKTAVCDVTVNAPKEPEPEVPEEPEE